MLVTKKQPLYKLKHKARIANGKKNQDNNKKLKARVAKVVARTENSNNKSLFVDNKHKIIT